MLGQLTPELLDELAGILDQALSWSSGQQQAEVQRVHDLLKDRHGVDFS